MPAGGGLDGGSGAGEGATAGPTDPAPSPLSGWGTGQLAEFLQGGPQAQVGGDIGSRMTADRVPTGLRPSHSKCACGLKAVRAVPMAPE